MILVALDSDSHTSESRMPPIPRILNSNEVKQSSDSWDLARSCTLRWEIAFLWFLKCSGLQSMSGVTKLHVVIFWIYVHVYSRSGKALLRKATKQCAFVCYPPDFLIIWYCEMINCQGRYCKAWTWEKSHSASKLGSARFKAILFQVIGIHEAKTSWKRFYEATISSQI